MSYLYTYEHMDRQSQVQTTLQELDPDEFESLVATIWSAMGWETNVTQTSRDQGVDVIATKSGVVEQKLAIQAKCYAPENKVGRPSIQQYSSIQEQFPDVDSVAVVTSSGFTSEAISLAKQLNVKTVAGDELARTSIEYLTKKTDRRS